MIIATRYHDFSAGHKVTGHEDKCAHLHGHNYRVHFTVQSSKGVDAIGRVLDFASIKTRLCDWLEREWDHRFLIKESDPAAIFLARLFPDDVVLTTFNPTAENMARYLVDEIAEDMLAGTGCELIRCVVEETRKCSAAYEPSQKRKV
jgi:6-pyruvoyltetrahydropterin/6-carboxytetrahydropterin synthase